MYAKHPGAGINYIPNRPQAPPTPLPPPRGAAPPIPPPQGGQPPAGTYVPNRFQQGATPTPTPTPTPGGADPGLGGPPAGGLPGPGGTAGPVVAQPPAVTGNPKKDRRLQEIFQWQNFINNRTPPGQTPLDLPDKYKKARKQFNNYMRTSGPLNGQIEAEQGPPGMMQNQMIRPSQMDPIALQRLQANALRGGGGGGGGGMMQTQEF